MRELAPQIPPEFLGICTNDVRPYAVGRCGARIYRASGREGPAWLKVSLLCSAERLDAERARLEWLQPLLPVPRVLAYAESGPHAFLALAEVAGEPGHVWSGGRGVGRVVDALVEALGRLHEVPLDECPFAPAWEAELALARATLAEGTLDRAAFVAAAGDQPEAVLDALSSQPHPPSRVLTHGDLCLPNLMFGANGGVGYLDWAAAGPGAPERDLVPLLDSIARNCGASAVEGFLDAYGRARIDWEALTAHRRLDLFATHVFPITPNSLLP